MTLYIDGDAFPNGLKAILFRAIERFALPTFVISNKRINIGNSNQITYIIVDAGPDEADQRIIEMVKAGDLIITADIPLADSVITKKAYALDHRGKFFSEDNVKYYLSMRNLMQELRDSGMETKGPAAFSQKDAHEFANQLNKFLTEQQRLGINGN
ncbi:MAG: YaiI/YqxD family protein [Candidatus Omnitrophica bacterium]|nr:YaiI/YqxD family protein [Candidatus Omnitrophota bacterium]